VETKAVVLSSLLTSPANIMLSVCALCPTFDCVNTLLHGIEGRLVQADIPFRRYGSLLLTCGNTITCMASTITDVERYAGFVPESGLIVFIDSDRLNKEAVRIVMDLYSQLHPVVEVK